MTRALLIKSFSILLIVYIPLTTHFSSALPLSLSKLTHCLRNMSLSYLDLKSILVLYLTKTGKELKQYATITCTLIRLSDYSRMRMLLKKNGRLKKEHAARPRNKQFGLIENKKNLNEKSKNV